MRLLYTNRQKLKSGFFGKEESHMTLRESCTLGIARVLNPSTVRSKKRLKTFKIKDGLLPQPLMEMTLYVLRLDLS